MFESRLSPAAATNKLGIPRLAPTNLHYEGGAAPRNPPPGTLLERQILAMQLQWFDSSGHKQFCWGMRASLPPCSPRPASQKIPDHTSTLTLPR